VIFGFGLASGSGIIAENNRVRTETVIFCVLGPSLFLHVSLIYVYVFSSAFLLLGMPS
jgi:hypothetical protein